jgi:hypothetical protein
VAARRVAASTPPLVVIVVVVVVVLLLDGDDAPPPEGGGGGSRRSVGHGVILAPRGTDPVRGGERAACDPARTVVLVAAASAEEQDGIPFTTTTATTTTPLPFVVVVVDDRAHGQRALDDRHPLLELGKHIRVGASACGGVAALVEHDLSGRAKERGGMEGWAG